VRTRCRVLKFSASGCYAWFDRRPSGPDVADAAPLERIATTHERSFRKYGRAERTPNSPSKATAVNRKRITLLMHRAALVGLSRRGKFVRTTVEHY
jgi:hypothetical protein